MVKLSKNHQALEREWLESIGDLREYVRNSDRWRASWQFVIENHVALLRQYPRWWIGVLDGRVVTKARSQGALLRRIDREGLPRRCIYTEHMDPVDRMFARIGGQLVSLKPWVVRRVRKMNTPEGWQRELEKSTRRYEQDLRKRKREAKS